MRPTKSFFWRSASSRIASIIRCKWLRTLNNVNEKQPMKREFYQSHECGRYRAKVTVEWEFPDDAPELTPNWVESGEAVAESALEAVGHKAREIVEALRGRSLKTS